MQTHKITPGNEGHCWMDQASGRWAAQRCPTSLPAPVVRDQSAALPPPRNTSAPLASSSPHLQMLLSDMIASQYLRHPTIVFTLPMSVYIQPPAGRINPALNYHDPGVLLRYPPEWQALAGSAEFKTMG